MRTAVFCVWAVTAVVGGYLLTLWLSGGGLRQQATQITLFPAALVFCHPLLALTGLGCWIGFLATGVVGFAWAAFGCLCATALLGFAMFTRWLAGRGGRHARGAEQRFPLAAVALHGTVGLITFVLVLIVATTASHR
jgi:hypothetical protein